MWWEWVIIFVVSAVVIGFFGVLGKIRRDEEKGLGAADELSGRTRTYSKARSNRR
jgi:hypothetical protein